MATDKPRYSITVDEDTFRRIEDFRFDNRFQSRSEATLELIKLGMGAFDIVSEKTGMAEKDLYKIYMENPESFFKLMSTPE